MHRAGGAGTNGTRGATIRTYLLIYYILRMHVDTVMQYYEVLVRMHVVSL